MYVTGVGKFFFLSSAIKKKKKCSKILFTDKAISRLATKVTRSNNCCRSRVSYMEETDV